MTHAKKAQQVINSNAHLREWVRRQADAYGTRYPVEVVEGHKAPTLEGESGYYTTLSGKTRVMHPGAYKWPTIYHCSTIRVEVGADWLSARRPKTFSSAVEAA